VAHVMFGEEEFPLDVFGGRDLPELLCEEVLLEELLANPKRDGHLEGAQSAWSEGQVGFKEPLELEEGLVVEDDVVDVVERNAFGVKAVLDGVPGEG